MEYENKLVDFIDGELPEDEERELFSMISADDSLRAEYKSLLGITNTIKSSAAYYSPSTELKASIYGDLNISVPSSHIPAPVKFLQGTKWHLLSGGIGALLASSVFIISTNTLSTDNKNISSIKSDKPPIVNLIDSPKMESKLNKIILTKGTHNIIPKTHPEKVNLITKEIPEYNNMNLIAMSEPVINFQNNIRTEKNLSNDNIAPSELSYNIAYLKKDDLDISIEARWSLNWNLPKESIQPAKANEFNNLGFDVFFNVIDNLDFGINIRQETFFVKYIEFVSNDMKYEIEQNPNLTSYGLSIRQKFLTENDLQLLAQLNFAVNNYGLIIRPSAGILFKINDSFALVENLEYSNMFFTHNQNWFNASKIGLNFGINYKF
ncbi:MAG: hypothetical protein HZB41_12235 [Ignavibacteriae bacterium]|nr:hypothetical protein [Ignavibacteriota bacterium]